MAVHAKDAAARQFYEHFWFVPSPSDPLHLYLLLKAIPSSLPVERVTPLGPTGFSDKATLGNRIIRRGKMVRDSTLRLVPRRGIGQAFTAADVPEAAITKLPHEAAAASRVVAGVVDLPAPVAAVAR